MKTVIASILILGASLANAANHVIQVAPGGKLVFSPSDLTAAIGDTLEFEFTVGVALLVVPC
jgi:plastocyanin